MSKRLRSLLPLESNNLFIGMKVYLTEELSKIYEGYYTFFGEKSTIPAGVWNVVSINKDEDGLSINILHETWDPKKMNPLYISFCNKSNSIKIVVGNSTNHCLYRVFSNLKELDQANSNRNTCASCGRNLTMFGMNYRVCNICDSIMNQFEIEKEQKEIIKEFDPEDTVEII